MADPPVRGRVQTAWARRSLRARVTAVSSVAMGLALVLAAIGFLLLLRASLYSGLDDTAEQRARDLVDVAASGELTRVLPATAGDAGLAQVVSSEGRVVASSPSLAGAPLVFPPMPAGTARYVSEDVHVLGTPYRVVSLRAGSGLVVYVGSSLTEAHAVLAAAAVGTAVGVPLLMGLLGAVVWVMVGYTLRTVDRLRKQVAAVSATDLHRRVEVPPVGDEIGRLAVTMNDLLARLEQAAAAQRQFVADAAHELRSPLAALTGQLELAVRHPQSAAWEQAAPDLLSDAERLGRLVDDLVALARLDEPARRRRRDPVDLDEIVLAEVRRARRASRVDLDARRVGAGLVDGDADALTRVVRNLLDNAIRYARSCVRVSLQAEDAAVQLVVADDGPGIAPADRDRAFARFTRLDDDRSRDRGGSGLGLAIVREIVADHGGSVRIEQDVGARLVVRLPAAEPAVAGGP